MVKYQSWRGFYKLTVIETTTKFVRTRILSFIPHKFPIFPHFLSKNITLFPTRGVLPETTCSQHHRVPPSLLYLMCCVPFLLLTTVHYNEKIDAIVTPVSQSLRSLLTSLTIYSLLSDEWTLRKNSSHESIFLLLFKFKRPITIGSVGTTAGRWQQLVPLCPQLEELLYYI